MKSRVIVRFIMMGLLFGICMSYGKAIAQTGESIPAYKEGELLVKFKSGGRTQSISSYRENNSVAVIQSFDTIGVDHIKLSADMSVDDALAMFNDDPGVEYAEPNYIQWLDARPNDEFFPLQWGLHNTGQEVRGQSGTPDADIDAPEAWDTTHGNKGIVVAVIDSGIDFSQQDLTQNLWVNPSEGTTADGIDNDGNGYVDDAVGWDFYGNDRNPNDRNGHGSHVAGIIGARGNNSGYGTTGVCWDISLMILKVTDPEGSSFHSDTIRALNYAAQKRVHIINLSMGGSQYSQAYVDALRANSQAVIVCAAGNGGDDGVGDDNDTTPHYPANFALSNIISVAASNQTDNPAGFSNYGRNSVDLAAPGVNILSPVNRTNYYGYKSGTSMATPMVSGVAALILSVRSLSPGQVVNVIMQTVDPKPGLAGKVKTGGRLNAYSAVLKALTIAEEDSSGCFIKTILPSH